MDINERSVFINGFKRFLCSFMEYVDEWSVDVEEDE